MFGEKSIYGNSTVRVDNKGRIFLPSFTYATKGDELIVVRDDNKLIITKEDEIEKNIDTLEKMLLEETDKLKLQQLEEKLLRIYSNILKKSKVDSQRRLNISGTVGINKEYRIIGARKSIYLIKEVNQRKLSNNI